MSFAVTGKSPHFRMSLEVVLLEGVREGDGDGESPIPRPPRPPFARDGFILVFRFCMFFAISSAVIGLALSSDDGGATAISTCSFCDLVSLEAPDAAAIWACRCSDIGVFEGFFD